MNEKPSLSFKDLVSGFSGKNKNGIIARFSFDDFFIDLYFIENGPLAYAPNTIWINVGFESVPYLPFSIYDILTVAEPENFKCYTYPYLYTEDIMIQSFGEINDLFKRLAPKLTEISNTGTQKNNLISNQKETINKFVNDDIFKREIEMMDASLKIRDMLIRNFQESIINHIILGGVSNFFNNEHEKAIKKLEKAKNLTFYESRLFSKLKAGELEGFDASPFRDAKFKDYTKIAKKRTYSLGKNGTFRFLITSLLLTPIASLVIFLLYLLFSFALFNKSLLFMNCDIYSLITLLISGALVAELISLNFSQKLFGFFKKKKDKKDEVVTVKKKSSFMKISAILTETIVIILLFSAVNNSLAFYENKVSFAEDSAISLRQNSIKYEYIDTVYKADGFYLNDNFFESEHYILVSKNGDRIDTGLYLNNSNNEFKKSVLPKLLENGCSFKEIKSEEEIK
ncbi:MAG: hypothetical protein IKT89_04535 [Clostridia bacterium]|nr:hypothetical protein [Clostridia bacterium]